MCGHSKKMLQKLTNDQLLVWPLGSHNPPSSFISFFGSGGRYGGMASSSLALSLSSSPFTFAAVSFSWGAYAEVLCLCASNTWAHGCLTGNWYTCNVRTPNTACTMTQAQLPCLTCVITLSPHPYQAVHLDTHMSCTHPPDTWTYTHVHTQFICTHKYNIIRTCTYTRTSTQAHMHGFMHTYTCTNIRMHTHTHQIPWVHNQAAPLSPRTPAG